MRDRRQLAYGFVDQGLSSASNMLMMLAIARGTTVDEFGVVAVLFTVLTTVLAVVRGGIGTGVLLGSGLMTVQRRVDHGRSAAVALITGVLVGAAVWIIGWCAGIPQLALPCAVAAPLLYAQDVQRYIAMAAGRARLAIIWDGAWTVGSLTALLLTWFAPAVTTPTAVLWAWTLCAALSLTGLAVGSRVFACFSGLGVWWRTSARDRLRYAFEAAIGSAGALVIALVAIALIGPDASAALRGAGTVFGPINILISAIPLAVIPHVIRSGAGPTQTWATLRMLAVLMSAAVLVIGIVGTLLPDQVGAELLGPTWSVTAPLLVFTGIEYAGLVWCSCVMGVLRAQNQSAGLLTARSIMFTMLTCGCVMAGLVTRSAVGMSVGLAVAGVLCGLLLVATTTSKGNGPVTRLGRRTSMRIVA